MVAADPHTLIVAGFAVAAAAVICFRLIQWLLG